MAYVVGSVSVEVVPDFRNAQNAITAWFKSQPDSFKIPVKPEFDKNATDSAVRDATNVGSRVGKAMADAQSAEQKKALAKAIAFAETQAYREAAIREKALAREAADREKSNAREFTDEIRTAERIAAEELRIERAAIDARTRLIEEEARAAHNFQVAEARKTAAAIKSAIGLSRTAAAQDEKLKIQVEIDKRKAIEEGRETGGLIARSINHEIHQNAGLIAGVLAGVLAAGAPVALAGAVALFGGIGAVAAAQSERVRSVWVGAWDQIKSGAIADAQILVPVFERMAGAIAASFERMRPFLRDAFAAIGPQIDQFVQHLTNAAENALPGLVEAVRSGAPVIEGLGDLMESTGTGLSEFFSILSTSAPAAGQVFTELGSAMEEILPLLANLLSTGAETASIVLPALTTAFGTLNSVASALSGVLPTLLSGFLAFRVINGIARTVSNWSASLQQAADAGGRFAGAQGKVAGVLSKVGGALPVLGLGVGVVAAAMADGEQQIQDWGQALLDGGDAANQAIADMKAAGIEAQALSTGFAGFISAFTASGVAVQAGATASAGAMELAEQRARDLYAAMSPLGRAQQDVATASNELEEAVGLYGGESKEAAVASANLAQAQARLAGEQAAVEMATRGVTDAMIEMNNQARAQVDSAFAHRQALDDLQDAQETYQELVDSGTASAEELRDALDDVEEGYLNVAQTVGDKAIDALPAGMDDATKSIAGAKAELAYFQDLLAQGVDLPPEIDEYILDLEQFVAGADDAAVAQGGLISALAEVGIAAEAIPGEKAVKVEALTDPAIAALEALGFDVEQMEDGSFKITAETDEAEGKIGEVAHTLEGLDGYEYTPVLDADDRASEKIGKAAAALEEFGGSFADAVLDADDYPYRKKLQGALEGLRNFASQRPTPPLDADGGPVGKKVGDALRGLQNFASQRPTPPLNADGRPAEGQVGKAMANLANYARQNPTPTLSAKDAASAVINGIISRIAAVQSKTVTITTVQRTIIEGIISSGVSKSAFAAEGGAPLDNLRPVPRFDLGGSLHRFTGEVFGRGGPKDDLIDSRLSPTEHVLDSGDVARMGGQAGVYAFREMLSSGQLGANFDVRRIVAATQGNDRQAAVPTSKREVHLYTPNIPEAIRALRADEHQQAALAAVW